MVVVELLAGATSVVIGLLLLMVLVLVFAFGCSVGFLGERSVIHPLFGEKPSKHKNQRTITHGRTMGLCVSLPPPVQGPLYWQEAPTVGVWALAGPVFLG